MELSEVELKELWARSDEYFQFSFEEYKSFGSRLKKWRELNNLTQRDVAYSIYKAKEALQLPLSTTDSLVKMYGKWESKGTGFDTVFSIDNLKILKNLLNVDYDFLFCECDTPHRTTKGIAKQVGLSIKSIEKLSSLNKHFCGEDTSSVASYSYALLSSLDAILSDDDLLCYLSYFLTHVFCEEESEDEEYNTISILKPVNGSSDEDSILDGETFEIDFQTQLSIFTVTIAAKLCNLRDKMAISSTNVPTKSEKCTAQSHINNTFGERLKSWRKLKNLTQNDVTELIIDYKENNSFPVIDKKSILRTYQNWEGKTDDKKEVRISLQDIKMLKCVFGCSYSYLFGEDNNYRDFSPSIPEVLGLSKKSIEKLSCYTSSLYSHNELVPAFASQVLSAIDLILSDNELLSDLTYFLSDLPYYPRLNFSTVLKPIDFVVNSPSDIAYSNLLFKNREFRNVFLPNICKHLILLKEQYYNNHLQK